jgi:hypothetical protein
LPKLSPQFFFFSFLPFFLVKVPWSNKLDNKVFFFTFSLVSLRNKVEGMFEGIRMKEGKKELQTGIWQVKAEKWKLAGCH